MAQHLLAAADRYGIERLRLLSETRLCEDLSINSVATTLALAEQHHCFQLKDVCLKFVASPENLKGEFSKTMLCTTFDIIMLGWGIGSLVDKIIPGCILNFVRYAIFKEKNDQILNFVFFFVVIKCYLDVCGLFCEAVMETEGYDYLQQSCPSVVTELLQYVARIDEHSNAACGGGYGKVTLYDGSDANRRRVKQRVY